MVRPLPILSDIRDRMFEIQHKKEHKIRTEEKAEELCEMIGHNVHGFELVV